MSSHTATSTPSAQPSLDPDRPTDAWLTRFGKGIAVGIGFILPGLSGGVLAVIFRIYDPLIRFLANPGRNLMPNVRYFAPVGVGAVVGIQLFSVVVAAAFGRFEAAFVCLFIGFVVGTVPSLWRQAGLHGRTSGDRILLAISTVAVTALMLLGGTLTLQVAPGIGSWFVSGTLIGLGVIVPGLSPSNFLIYAGLYDAMAEGIAAMNPVVVVPLFVGMVVSVILLARGARWLFHHHYAAAYHVIVGLVVGSSLAIFPTVVFTREAVTASGLSLTAFVALNIAMLGLGTAASWLFSRVEDRYAEERTRIDDQL